MNDDYLSLEQVKKEVEETLNLDINSFFRKLDTYDLGKTLTETLKKRICLAFIYGGDKKQVAKREGVNEGTITPQFSIINPIIKQFIEGEIGSHGNKHINWVWLQNYLLKNGYQKDKQTKQATIESDEDMNLNLSSLLQHLAKNCSQNEKIEQKIESIEQKLEELITLIKVQKEEN
jgi:hypothetical protein